VAPVRRTAADTHSALRERSAGISGIGFPTNARDDGTLLRVEWIPEIPSTYGAGIRLSAWTGLRITVSPLPAAERAAARRALVRRALPELCAWVGEAPRRSETWLLGRHGRSCERIAAWHG